MKLYNLRVFYTGNYIVKGRNKNTHIYGNIKDFSNEDLNIQMRKIKSLGVKGGIIRVSLNQVNILNSLAFAKIPKK